MSPTIKKLYYSIGEVSEMTDLKSYVLRYWETEFNQLKPPKNRAGNRTYRQKDIETILNNLADSEYKKLVDGVAVVGSTTLTPTKVKSAMKHAFKMAYDG